MATIFFTGFPGFLGSELLPRVLARARGDKATCLVQGKYAELARRRAREVEARYPDTQGRIEIVEGDITEAGLGLPASARDDVTELFHLAAVYDLSVGRNFAMRVNVDGTRHVLAFAEKCPKLERLQYVSTCYVSGKHPGVFREEDLEKGQSFNNFYEETKHLAEVDVRKHMAKGLPATIYRPSIVVGDSRDGATQKYDGPYFVIQWLMRQPKVAVMPVVGKPAATTLNVVPRDFVVDAMAHLSAQKGSLGKTYALADPAPLTVDEMLKELSHATGRRLLRVPLTLGLAKFAVEKIPGVYRLMRIPSSAIDYFVHPTRYDTTNTVTDLKDVGINVPPFTQYSHTLVRFVREHPEIGSGPMV